MINPSKHNGINFSYDFNRKSERYNFDNQRGKLILNRDIEIKYLSFLKNGTSAIDISLMTVYSKVGSFTLEANSITELPNGWIIYFAITSDYLFSEDSYAKVQINSDVIYSEIFCGRESGYFSENEICHIISSNNDDRHGFLSNQAFGFFKFSKLKSDIFLNKKTEYEYSYSRKKILSSENQIGKRFTFLDLTMYQQNLLKWLCNCENVSIDGVSYQLISDFTEVLSDENSEILDLRADFVEVNQSFFGAGSVSAPLNIFTNQFFIK